MAPRQENTDPHHDFIPVESMDRNLHHCNTKQVPPGAGQAIPRPFLYGLCALVILTTLMDKATLRAQELSRTAGPTTGSALSGLAPRDAARIPNPEPRAPALLSAYANLPLSFEANRGQAKSDVQFLSRGKGYTLLLGSGEAVLCLQKPGVRSETSSDVAPLPNFPRPPETPSGRGRRDEAESLAPAVLRMRLVGANTEAKATSLDWLPGKVNYFIGKDPAKWRTNIPTYGRVLYQNVYPGVDVLYYGNQGRLEYDFMVAPGADPDRITLQLETGNWKLVDGQSQIENRKSKIDAPLRIDGNGDLLVTTDDGEVVFHKPVIYQPSTNHEAGTKNEETTNKELIDGRYSVAGNRVTLEVANYDKTRPLFIDPTLTYSTYLGGSQGDVGYAVAVDSSGNAYIAGQTCSANFPTLSAEQPSLAGQCDAFVTKLNATGTALVYSTYLGGSLGLNGSPAGNSAAGIAVDSTGNAYVTGITNSNNFPTTAGSFQAAYQGGDSDAFITKLNPSGSALVYSTYLGGGDADSANAIAIDSSGDAFVTGETYSNPFPTTLGALQTTYGGRGDAFVTKLDPTGNALVYSSYLGGELQDAGNGIAVDNVGSAFVTGSTYSIFFPVMHAIQGNCGGYNPSNAPPCPLARDAFVSKFSADGSALVYSTYLGGSEDDVGTGIALDSLGAAYVAGFTTSIDFPVRPGALQSARAGTQNAFVTKVDPLGGAPFAYSTYLGGSGVDAATAIAVDSNAVAYVTGGTTSANFPTVGAIQPSLAGPLAYPGDAFVSKVNAFGSGLIYSSYLGGGDQDIGNGIAVDSSLGVYVTGSTLSTDFPTAPTSTSTPACPPTCPFQGAYGGAGDAFAIKMNALTAAVASISPRTLSFGNQGLGIPSAPQTVTITNSGDAVLLVSTIVEIGDIYQPPGIPLPPPVDLKDWAVTTDNCTGISVPPNSSCSFTVTFTPNPTAAPSGLGPGARTATITITDNATSGTQLINLTGNGVSPPAVLLLPASLSFGNQLSGTTSASQTVALNNSGGFALAISSISVSQSFAQTNNCGNSLGPGASCTITVTFSPTTPGSITGNVTINDDASNTPQTVSLTGTGAAPVVSLAPTLLTFSNQAVGTSSAAQTVVLSNTGNASLTVSSVALTGVNAADYTMSQTCGSPVSAGGSCAIVVTFSPKAAGTRLASVTVTDNASTSPQVISLSGSAVLLPAVTLAPTSLTFPGVPVGASSTPLTVALTNSSGAPLTITNTTVTGDFAVATTCGASVAGGASCTLSVTFAPTAVGNRNGSVTLTDNALDSPQSILLAGVGLAPAVTLLPTTVSFASQAAGTTSAAQAVTLTNTGTAPLAITGITLTGAFAQMNNCGASVAAGASCKINVTFTPTASGNSSGSLAVTDNAPGSPHTVLLSGVGAPAPLVSLSATSLTFTGQPVGATSAAQPVTLTNSGTATLTIASISASVNFAQTNTCAGTVTAGGSCTINVTFTPPAVGAVAGTLTITDNAAGSPHVVTLAGTGADFTISIKPSTLAVTAGSTANYTVNVSPEFGFTGSVLLSCSGLPLTATCFLSPNPVTPNGQATAVAMTVTTRVRSQLPPRSGPRFLPPLLVRPWRLGWFLWLLGVILTLHMATARPGRRTQLWPPVILGLVMVFVLVWVACGGGGGGGGAGFDPGGTPAGNYTLTITGASGSLTHSATATLTVN